MEAFTFNLYKVSAVVYLRPWCRSTTGGKNWAGCCCCYLTARKVAEVGNVDSAMMTTHIVSWFAHAAMLDIF